VLKHARSTARTAWLLPFRVVGKETGGHGVEAVVYVERSAIGMFMELKYNIPTDFHSLPLSTSSNTNRPCLLSSSTLAF